MAKNDILYMYHQLDLLRVFGDDGGGARSLKLLLLAYLAPLTYEYLLARAFA